MQVGQNDIRSSSVPVVDDASWKVLDIRLYLHNVGGIRSQLASVRSAVLSCEYDVIVLVETWFNKTVLSTELFDPKDWVVFRCDRCDCGDDREGGGVLIAVRLKLCPSPLDDPYAGDIELTWEKLSTKRGTIFIGATYIAPGSNDNYYDQLLQSTTAVTTLAGPTDHVFLLGDFNRRG